jgi:hypothetical protein
MAIADEQKLGGWTFTANYRHGFDEGVEPMPGEKPPDKSDVQSVTVKPESVTGFFLLMRHTDGWIDTVSNHMATVSCDTPLSLHPERNFPTHTDNRLCSSHRYP